MNHPNPFVRCCTEGCRSFLNATTEFDDDGRSWRCCFCGVYNDIPYGFRTESKSDRKRGRLDMQHSTMEYEVGDNFCTRDPLLSRLGGITMLLIDTSISARQSNQLSITTKSLLESIFNPAIASLSKGKRYALLTYDYSSVHLYSFSGKSFTTVAIPDLSDLFVPLSLSEMVATVGVGEAGGNNLSACLSALPSMFPPSLSLKLNSLGTDRTSAFGPALLVASHVLASGCGQGSLLAFVGSRPGNGVGALRNREIDVHKNADGRLFRPEGARVGLVDGVKENSVLVGGGGGGGGEHCEEKKEEKEKNKKEKEKEKDKIEKDFSNPKPKTFAYSPHFYSNVGSHLRRCNVSATILVATSGYADLAALSRLPSSTGGKVFRFGYLSQSPPLQVARYDAAIRDLIVGPFLNPTKIAYDAVVRVRVSKGLVVTGVKCPWGDERCGLASCGTIADSYETTGFVPGNGEHLFRSGSAEVNGRRAKKAQAAGKTAFSLPILTPDSTFDADLEFDQDVLNEAYNSLRDGLGGVVSIQLTTLYTTFFGKRRLRVSNVDFDTSMNSQKVALGADLRVLSSILTRRAVNVARREGIMAARQEVSERSERGNITTKLLFTYKTHIH